MLNNIKVEEQPKEISILNDYEKMLIQRFSKLFKEKKQCLIRIYLIIKKPRSKRRRTFHLPLPMKETQKNMPR